MSDHLSARDDTRLAVVTASDFRDAMDESFHLSHAGGELDLRLIEVAEQSGGRRTAGAFTLLFATRPGSSLQQAIYTISHARLGTLDIFLVPIGSVEGGDGYEAVFA